MRNLHIKHILIFLALLVGISTGMIQAQVDLSQQFISQNGQIVFRHPLGWTPQEDATSVRLTDGVLTIEFLDPNLGQNLAQIGGSSDPQVMLTTLLQVLGIPAAQQTTFNVQARTVVGTLSAVGGAGQLVLAVNPALNPSNTAFVSVTGPAINLLSGTDTVVAIVQTYGQFIDATEAPKPGDVVGAPAVTAEAVAPAVPCTVSSSREGAASVHVGPGNNRTSIRFLEPNRPFDVLGTANADDGTQWWRLDKTQAAPSQAAQVNETWVAASEVEASGGCEQVQTVSAPPIVPFRTPPEATPEATPSDPNEIFISFFADRPLIQPGECVTLTWDVRNIQEVYFQGSGVSGQGFSLECPTESTTYELRVVPVTGPDIFRMVRVEVGCEGFVDELPATRTATLPVGGTQSWNFNIDPCMTPALVTVSMTATSASLDPYIEIYADGFFIAQDDDGAGYPNSREVITLPEGTTVLRVVARSFANASGGSYTLSVVRS